jgi:enolase-phosphatase E1
VSKALLVDIEGTIGDAAFVKTVLFPYARERLEAFLATHETEPRVQAIVADAGVIAGRTLVDREETVALFRSWIDEDKKATPLKTLQGMIWQGGYEEGVLRAHLYDDAVVLLRELAARGVPLWVYSSGSVEAQRLYFRFSTAGDVTSLFRGFFDTRIGAKVEAASYARIASEIGAPASEILFATDLAAEIVAARAAGFATVRVDRTRALSSAIEKDELGLVVSSFEAIAPFLTDPPPPTPSPASGGRGAGN